MVIIYVSVSMWNLIGIFVMIINIREYIVFKGNSVIIFMKNGF